MGSYRRVRSPEKPFSLLVKPAGASCNLACEYCFYLPKADLYPDSRPRMTGEVLERLVASYMETRQDPYSFVWQGGEPTLMGVEFFRAVVELQEHYAAPGTRVSNALQTNGTLMNPELVELLGAYRFLVGVSVDGPPEVHNRYRRRLSGEGSHDAVARAIRRLLRAGVAVNALVLVTRANVERAPEVYRHLVDLGVTHHQYIPCVEFDASGHLKPYAITGGQWGRFLIRLLDTWASRDVRRISIRHHDALVGFLVDGRRELCTMAGRCDAYYIVEHNGDVYPCDFYVEPDLRLGNIVCDEWGTIVRNPSGRAFAARKAAWPDRCVSCRHLPYCSGDCTRQRVAIPPGAGSSLCEGWQAFYDAALPILRPLADRVVGSGRGRTSRWDPAAHPPDEPCYCGSGRKARNCHLAAANQEQTLSATTSRSTSSAT